jgi:hypothetical protein
MPSHATDTTPMPSARSQEPLLRVSPHARRRTDAAGTVVMDLRAGKYLALNPVGAEIWVLLEAGASAAQVLEHLTARFEVEPARLRADVEGLLSALQARGLVVATTGAPPRATASSQPPPRRAAAARLPAAEARAEPGTVAIAWLGLVATDVALHVAGFRRLHRVARALRVRDGMRAPTDTRVVARTRAAVDRAAKLYFKRAWCLQRSVVTALLLRARGLPAELVVGVRSAPFMAHAWVELDGKVVNDAASVETFYQEIERC